MRRRFWRTCAIRMILTGGTVLSGSPFRMTAYMSFRDITPMFLFFWDWRKTNGWTSWWRAAKESGVILTIRAACYTPFEIAGNKSINISGTIRSGDRDPANSSKSLWSAWSEKLPMVKSLRKRYVDLLAQNRKWQDWKYNLSRHRLFVLILSLRRIEKLRAGIFLFFMRSFKLAFIQ